MKFYALLLVMATLFTPVHALAGNPDQDGAECEGGCGEAIVRLQPAPTKRSWINAPRSKPERVKIEGKNTWLKSCMKWLKNS